MDETNYELFVVRDGDGFNVVLMATDAGRSRLTFGTEEEARQAIRGLLELDDDGVPLMAIGDAQKAVNNTYRCILEKIRAA